MRQDLPPTNAVTPDGQERLCMIAMMLERVGAPMTASPTATAPRGWVMPRPGQRVKVVANRAASVQIGDIVRIQTAGNDNCTTWWVDNLQHWAVRVVADTGQENALNIGVVLLSDIEPLE